jgi:DNA mismatch repair protein MutS2
MSPDLLRVLEFDKFIALLARFTASEPGRALVLALAPLGEETAVKLALAEATEMVTYQSTGGTLPLAGNRDLLPLLGQLQAEGSWLAPLALLDLLVSLEAAQECRRALAGRAELENLQVLAAGITPLRDLADELRGTIGPRGEILDRASADLAAIRRQMLQLRARIRKTLEGLLLSERYAGVFQDNLVTERNGRYVLPVRADHRSRIKGFVHDESASGQTLYVEPATVLDANNELQHLQREEKREEERILRRLSAAARHYRPALLENQRILTRLDLRAAIARYARLTDACAPQLVATPLLELRSARHPLLLIDPAGSPRNMVVVAIDLLLGEESDTLVVSGPNTGGKTVALKTAGLLLTMVKAGLPIPCSPASRVHLFARLFADIGDEQSLEQSLSTFSGHLVRLREILTAADSDSLVLLDEVGTGTDPSEGGALALAILDTLRERGARVMVTTHLNLVKGYAQLHPGVSNAAVEFDHQTLAPAYRLHYGIPGASNAMTIARRLGLPEDVLARAEAYLGDDERAGLQVMEELNLLKQQAYAERDIVRQLRVQAEVDRDKRKRLLQESEAQRQELLEKATRRADRLLRDTEARLKTILSQAEAGTHDARSRAELTSALHVVRDEVTQVRSLPAAPPKPPTEVKLGEILRIVDLQSEGEVTRLLDGGVELDCGGKKLRLPLARLAPCSPRRFARKGAARMKKTIEDRPLQTKLLLVGKRMEEALILLDRALDDALINGLSEMEIVHGAGEGILRRAVREFLSGHQGIRGFHPAEAGHGGDNVTVVELNG